MAGGTQTMVKSQTKNVNAKELLVEQPPPAASSGIRNYAFPFFFPLSISIRPVGAGGGRGAYRVEAIDMFRGLTMFICVVVNNRGEYFDTAVDNLVGHPYIHTLLLGYRHVPWNGIYFSDFVLPFFHTAMGCGVFLNYGKKTPNLNTAPEINEMDEVSKTDQYVDRQRWLGIKKRLAHVE